MFTIVEKLIYIDHKNLKKMKNVTFIKWLAAGKIHVQYQQESEEKIRELMIIMITVLKIITMK